jgi:pimeloyl-ACP methyl ester carboxylesterase
VLYLSIILLGVAVLALLGIVYQQLGLRGDAKRCPPPGRLIDVGGCRLHLHEIGSGWPTVILESGISASSLNWRIVQYGVAKFARVCSYDRAGLGWSELTDEPCTPASLAAQLHRLLQSAKVPGPYILVGHSFGGLIVRAFAKQFCDEVAGIILVDPLDPAEWTPLSDVQRRTIRHGVRLSRRGALAAKVGIVRCCLNLLLAGNRLLPRIAAKAWSGRASSVTGRIASQVEKMPAETWPLVASHWKQPKCFEGMARHFDCLAQSLREMADAPPISLPVTMLVGGQNEHPVDPQLYAKRVSRETKLVVAEKSGHWIQLDEPELVIESIREVVESVRKNGVGSAFIR